VQALLDSAERLMRAGLRRGVPAITELQIHAWLKEREATSCTHDCIRCPMLPSPGSCGGT
jgi:hypothetical protein